MMKMRDVLVHELAEQKVDVVFTLPAYYITELTCSIREKGIKLVEFRSEYSAAFAAISYSKCASKVGVLCINTGPSFTNAITGIKTAQKEKIPLLVIVGTQFGEKECNEAFFQSIDYDNIGIKSYLFDVDKGISISKCMEEAKEKLEPIILRIPSALYNREINEMSLLYNKFEVKKQGDDVFEDIDFSAYTNPLFIFGEGSRGVNDEFKIFPYKYVSTVMMRTHCLNRSNKNYIGAIGILGDEVANEYLEKADFLICVGCRLSERSIMNNEKIMEGKHVLYVNRNKEVCRYQKSKVQFIEADAVMFVNWILRKSRVLDLTIMQEDIKKQDSRCVYSNSDVLTVDAVVAAINDSALYDVPVCVDDGQYTLSALKYNITERIIFYGSVAAGGSSIGSAIGASMAYVDENIIIIIGDGGILSVLGELQTIKKYELPIIVLLINNGGYESIRQWYPEYQENFGEIAFYNIAKAFNMEYICVNNLCTLKNELTKRDKPTLIEIMVETMGKEISHWEKYKKIV